MTSFHRRSVFCWWCYRILMAFMLVVMVLLSGCASTSSDTALQEQFDQINDPLEPMNRYFFAINEFLDFLILHPAADSYERIVPQVIRTRIRNFLRNIGEIPVLFNTFLQGRFTDSSTTLARFLINTTAGIGGLFDVAAELELEKQQADFGQTLYTYGIGEGPYLFLPILGPSNPRDLTGFIVDRAANPLNYVLPLYAPQAVDDGLTYGPSVLGGISRRASVGAQLNDLRRNSLDFYAQLRSISRQLRRGLLQGAERPINDAQQDPFYDDPFYDDSDDTDLLYDDVDEGS